MSTTVIAMFDTEDDALRAKSELTSNFAIPTENIEVVRAQANEPNTATEKPSQGLWEKIKDFFGGNDEDRRFYSEGLRRGGILLSAAVADADVTQIRTALDECGAVDLQERSAEWKTGGRQETAPRKRGEDVVVPIVEEEIDIQKRPVQRGKVQVESKVVEKPVEENVSVREEHVRVERVPVDRPIMASDLEAFKEGTIEVTEGGEEVVVGKRAHVVEEVIIGKEETERTETVRDTLRRTDVDVREVGANERSRMGSNIGSNIGSNMGSSMGSTAGRTGASLGGADVDESAFRQHFTTSFADRGYEYEELDPAYRYGSDLGREGRFRDWNEVEQSARSGWERDHPGTWERVRDAIRHAWERARTSVSQAGA